MGSHPRQQQQQQGQQGGRGASPTPAGWTPEQMAAGGRRELSRAAPGRAQGIATNWVTPPPAAPAPGAQGGRDGLAHMIAMTASNNGNYYPGRDFWTGRGRGGAWMEGGRGGSSSGGYG